MISTGSNRSDGGEVIWIAGKAIPSSVFDAPPVGPTDSTCRPGSTLISRARLCGATSVLEPTTVAVGSGGTAGGSTVKIGFAAVAGRLGFLAGRVFVTDMIVTDAPG
jgi:hypothetical protein